MRKKDLWIKITSSEALERFAKGETIDGRVEDLEVTYYRKKQPVYIVRWWLDDMDDFKESEFKTLAKAKKFGLKYCHTFDINYYDDYKDRCWTKQYQYIQNELVGEEEQ